MCVPTCQAAEFRGFMEVATVLAKGHSILKHGGGRPRVLRRPCRRPRGTPKFLPRYISCDGFCALDLFFCVTHRRRSKRNWRDNKTQASHRLLTLSRASVPLLVFFCLQEQRLSQNLVEMTDASVLAPAVLSLTLPPSLRASR